MFENLQDSIDRDTSRFERNVVRFTRKKDKRLSDWTVHDYRASFGGILAAAVMTLLEWIAIPFQWSWNRLKGNTGTTNQTKPTPPSRGNRGN